MIPKIIHYCWFGGKPLPESAKKCIASWRKFLPDYEIKEWNETNFDVNIIPYTAEAYSVKKYAFVSDYARFWILYKYGGLYFDTDVEVIKNMDDIIGKGPFMGCENEAQPKATPYEIGVNPGLGLGVPPGFSLYGEILDIYGSKHYILPDGTFSYITVVDITTGLLCKKGLKNTNEIQYVDGVWIYPKEFFCPKDYKTGVMYSTYNTRTIHHYSESWLPWYMKVEGMFWQKIGFRKNFFITRFIFRIQKNIRTLLAIKCKRSE